MMRRRAAVVAIVVAGALATTIFARQLGEFEIEEPLGVNWPDEWITHRVIINAGEVGIPAGRLGMLQVQPPRKDGEAEVRLIPAQFYREGKLLASDQIVPAVQTVAPPQWLRAQVEHILDEMALYVTGRQEGFEVVVPLKDRIQVAVPVVKQLLRDVDAYESMFDQVITTMVEDNLEQMTELPFGVTITADEIIPAVREVLPPEFIQEQAESMIDGVVPFLTGEAEGFRVVVPLADRKEAALGAIERLANRSSARYSLL